MARGRLSAYYQARILEHMFLGQPFEPPGRIYAGLLVRDGDRFRELRGEGYARQRLELSNVADGQVTNSAEITFGSARADWGMIEAAGIWDAFSNGNLLAWSMLEQPKSIPEGDSIVIPAGKWEQSIT